MITDQIVNDHDDMRKVTDNILRDAGMTISDGGGNVTFAGKEPVRKTVIKAGATTSCVLAANAVADAAIWRERTGEGQDIHVDMRKAWIEQSPWQKDALQYTMINGVSKAWNPNVFVMFGGFARARDSRTSRATPRGTEGPVGASPSEAHPEAQGEHDRVARVARRPCLSTRWALCPCALASCIHGTGQCRFELADRRGRRRHRCR